MKSGVSNEHAMFHFVSEPVESKIQMFHATMVFRILGNSNCTLVVHLESGGLLNAISKFSENVPHPCNLLPSLNCCHILCLTVQQWFAACCTIQLHHQPSWLHIQ